VTDFPVLGPVADPAPPEWLQPLLAVVADADARDITRFLPPKTGGQPAAVLVLFGEGRDGPDVLLIERAAGLRRHAGQPAFPGGALDPTDDGPVAAALREAEEEVGLDPSGVAVLATLPDLYLPVTGFVVTPVLAWWQRPTPVAPVDPAEVAGVVRVPIAELSNPANRVEVHHPAGRIGPGFAVRDLLVWGFTAGLLDAILRMGGWERPWQPAAVRTVDPAQLRDRIRRPLTESNAQETVAAVVEEELDRELGDRALGDRVLDKAAKDQEAG
jgi:8-oxo-dGTP pyrophosphatase MutT (NUDIX family)